MTPKAHPPRPRNALSPCRQMTRRQIHLLRLPGPNRNMSLHRHLRFPLPTPSVHSRAPVLERRGVCPRPWVCGRKQAEALAAPRCRPRCCPVCRLKWTRSRRLGKGHLPPLACMIRMPHPWAPSYAPKPSAPPAHRKLLPAPDRLQALSVSPLGAQLLGALRDRIWV